MLKVIFTGEVKEIQYLIKPDYSKIEYIYGNLSPQIIARLTVDSPQTIINHLEKEGEVCFYC